MRFTNNDDFERRIAKLEKALKPFADAAARYDAPASLYGDPCPLRADPEDEGGGPRVGDLRRARDTLAGIER